MKGLLLKDFYMIWKYFKMHFLIDIVFIAISYFSYNNILFVTIPIMLAGVMPITLLAYDERSHWTEYCGALPYSGAQVVSAKYLVGLIMQTVTTVIVFISLLMRNNSFANSEFEEILLSVTAIFIIALMFPTICMPFSLKFGTEKGRIIYYVVVAAVTGAVMIAMESTDDIPREIHSNPSFMPIVLIGMFILYILSWLLSIILYNNREVGK